MGIFPGGPCRCSRTGCSFQGQKVNEPLSDQAVAKKQNGQLHLFCRTFRQPSQGVIQYPFIERRFEANASRDPIRHFVDR